MFTSVNERIIVRRSKAHEGIADCGVNLCLRRNIHMSDGKAGELEECKVYSFRKPHSLVEAFTLQNT